MTDIDAKVDDRPDVRLRLSLDVALKKTYVKKFSKGTVRRLTVAKFFQLDHRIDLLIGMQVEASLPPLWRPQNAQNRIRSAPSTDVAEC